MPTLNPSRSSASYGMRSTLRQIPHATHPGRLFSYDSNLGTSRKCGALGAFSYKKPAENDFQIRPTPLLRYAPAAIGVTSSDTNKTAGTLLDSRQVPHPGYQRGPAARASWRPRGS